MADPFYEIFHEISELGIQIAYHTIPGGYHPLHWHEEMEILFPLNGDACITIEGTVYHLRHRQLLVINSGQVHSTDTYSSQLMLVCIHISRRLLLHYMPDIESYRFCCIPDEITDQQFREYLSICQMAEQLTRLYIEDSSAVLLESEGIILQVLARLIRYFTVSSAPAVSSSDIMSRQRLRDIISFVNERFHEPISLHDGAELLGFSKEYFCRFFKKHMGLSFLQYLNEVRISHIYQALRDTDAPITEIMEANGFTNQKLFNKTFKKIYGRTPSEIRRGLP